MSRCIRSILISTCAVVNSYCEAKSRQAVAGCKVKSHACLLIGPDLGPNLGPDLRLDLGPDLNQIWDRISRPDLGPDLRPGLGPDLIPGLGPDLIPSLGPDFRPGAGSIPLSLCMHDGLPSAAPHGAPCHSAQQHVHPSAFRQRAGSFLPAAIDADPNAGHWEDCR